MHNTVIKIYFRNMLINMLFKLLTHVQSIFSSYSNHCCKLNFGFNFFFQEFNDWIYYKIIEIIIA